MFNYSIAISFTEKKLFIYLHLLFQMGVTEET